MSKTTQENKKKKVLEEQKVEETVVKTPRKAKKSEIAETELEAAAVTNLEDNSSTQPEESESQEKSIRVAKKHGKKYLDAKKKVDINKYYSLDEAVTLAQKTSISKFDGKIEAHLVVTEMGNLGEITFPHLETSSKKIVILNDTILAEIKDGKINFDILIATPATMPKLLPFARLLGPKGLMPNPKNGTLTDDPESSQKRLAVAKTAIKTEKKAPVVHIIVGKVSQPAAEIKANIEELIRVIKAPKIKKMVLSATIGPGVKVEIVK